VFDETPTRDDFLNQSGTFLWLDENDSNNTSLISSKISQNGAPNVS
jgi:hypothetical protein